MYVTRALHSLALLTFLLSACAPAVGPTPTGPAPDSRSSEPTAAVEAEEEPPPPAGLTDLLDEGIASGLWSESEGMVRLLGFLSGEANLSGVPRAGGMLAVHGTALIARARHYLETHQSDPAAGDVERLLGLLLPAQDDLDRFSIPETSLGRASGLAAPPVQPSCEEIWRTGWALDVLTGCFIRRDLGPTFTLYYPAEWHADGARMAAVEAVSEAARASEDMYAGLLGLTIPRTYLVFSLLGAEAFDEEDTVEAFADNGSIPCPIVFLPGSSGLATLRQTTAHEIFHCVTAGSFAPQIGPPPEATEWWEEGVSEYFSNVVYPNVDGEQHWLPVFDERSMRRSLVRMDYDAYLFFQFLANREGDPGVINLLHGLPTTGGLSDQEAALAGLVDQEMWHSFGQAYLEGSIIDTGGRPVRSAPTAPTVHIDGPMTLPPLEAEPFTLARTLLVFDDRKRYSLESHTAGADGRESAGRPLAGAGITPAGGWEAIPVEVNAPCRAGLWIVLATAAGAGGEARRVEMSASVIEDYPEDGECECLLGSWLLDTSSYETAFVSLMPPETDALLEEISGQVLMEFGDDGVVRSFIDWLSVAASFSVGERRALMQLRFYGSSRAGYVTGEGGVLTVTDPVEAISTDVTVAMGGAISTMPIPPLAAPTAASGFYTCEGDRMHFTPIAVGVTHPGLDYTRVSP